MSQIAVLTEDEIRQIKADTAQEASLVAIETYCRLIKLSPTEPLSIAQLAEQHGVDRQTLYSRINERHIPTVPYMGKKNQLAILPQHLYDLLKKNP